MARENRTQAEERKDATLSEAHGRKEIRGETALSKETLSDELRLKLVELLLESIAEAWQNKNAPLEGLRPYPYTEHK